MSRSVSTASRTVKTNLTDAPALSTTASTGIRFIFWVSTICLMYCLFLSLWTQLRLVDENLAYRPVALRYCDCSEEEFANIDTSATAAGYQSVPLNALDDSHMMVGQASRRIFTSADSTPSRIDIQITANLFQLNANVFAKKTDLAHGYKAYVATGNKRTLLGDLRRDGDGMYKLTFSSNDAGLLAESKRVLVTYELGQNVQTLLSGDFK